MPATVRPVRLDAVVDRAAIPAPASPMTVTIKDVAAHAGVSPKTVSRVMNAEQHVRASVRESVMRSVEQLGYRPNSFARSLSSARSYLIGLFSDDPASGYATAMQRGALKACHARSYHLLVEPVSRAREDWIAAVVDTATSLRLDGVILPPPLGDDPRLLDALDGSGILYALVSPGPGTRDRSAQVHIDEREAAFDLTRHLIALGHRDIGFIEGDPAHASAFQRRAGFEAAMAEAGLALSGDRVVGGDFSFRAGLEAGERLLASATPPSAIFASNDDMALGVSVAALKGHVAVPDRLSIAGFDDSAMARLAWPPITTVRQPVEAMGSAAVEILVDPAFRSGERTAAAFQRRLAYEIVERASTASV